MIILPNKLFYKNFNTPLDLAYKASQIFSADFISNKSYFMGYEIKLKCYPKNNDYGFNSTFWHIITKGEHENSIDEIDIDRTERIPWISPIINEPDEGVLIYWEKRKGIRRICLVLTERRYMVVLEPRYKNNKINYILLWSAFFIIPESNVVNYKIAYKQFTRKYGKFDINHCPL